ncbi:MAG: aminopeptidase P N-terminal domain-containing protein [Planctomycetota bacterium]
MRPLAVAVFLCSVIAPSTHAGPPAVARADAHRERRARLADYLKKGYALLLGQPFTDVLQPRQEGHLLYLTGADEPGASLLLCGVAAKPLEKGTREILFLRTGPPAFVQFYGLRHQPNAETTKRLGVDRIHAAPPRAVGLAREIAELLPKRARLHMHLYRGPDHGLVRELRREILEQLKKRRPDIEYKALDVELARLRSQKSEFEIAELRAAIATTKTAFDAALPAIRADGTESAVDAALVASIRRQGRRPAYGFVVASGANAALPHYFRNESPLLAGELLVIDAGAEQNRYAADVTRTFPVSGKFTKRQREVYEAVLAAQEAALALVRPGRRFDELQRAAHAVLAKAGLSRHFIHGISHHVGLDVHDPGPPVLAEGMTFTVEPGVYIREESLGVRIEDIVLVTKNGGEILTKAFPKTVDEVEAWLAGGHEERGR